MSWRQPARTKGKGARVRAKSRRAAARRARPSPFPFTLSPFPLSSVFDICHLTRPEAAEQLARPLAVELGVYGFDEHEEAVARGEREVRRVEDRVVRLGQP